MKKHKRKVFYFKDILIISFAVAIIFSTLTFAFISNYVYYTKPCDYDVKYCWYNEAPLINCSDYPPFIDDEEHFCKDIRFCEVNGLSEVREDGR